MKRKSRANKRICVGDKVIVIAGNDRGRTGKVMSRTEERILIQGINMRKRHLKKTREDQASGIIEMERPINISNVNLCGENDKPVKLKVDVDEKGLKQFYYKEDGQKVTFRPVKNKRSE